MIKTLRNIIAATLGALCLHLSSAAMAQERISWTLTTPFPASDVTAQRLMKFAKAAEEATDGRFRLKVLVAGQHPYQYRDGLRIATDGLAEISHTGLTYLTSVEPWFGLPMVPFAVPYDIQHEFTERWHEEIANPYLNEKYGLKVLAYFLDSGGWGNAIHTPVPLEDFDSLDGLMIRAHDKNTSALAQVFSATPATVPYSELYVAVQRKSIDGVMTSLQGAHAQKLWELLKHTNLYEPYFGVDEIVVSEKKWNSLPDDLKPTLEALFTEWFAMKPMYEFHSEFNNEIIETAKADHDATFSEISPEIREEARKRTEDLLDDYLAAGGEMGQKSVDLLNELMSK